MHAFGIIRWLASINKRPFFCQSWFNAGIKYVKDLMDSNSNFLKYNAFLSKYGIKANFLTYNGILSALVNYKKCFSQNHSSKDKRAEEIKAALKSCKGTYKIDVYSKDCVLANTKRRKMVN